MSIMKIKNILLVLIIFCVSGCIRHTDQQLPRKVNNNKKEQIRNVKRITPNLMVNDVNKTIDFYKTNIGFEVALTVPDTGSFDFAILSNDNIEIMFQRKDNFIKEYPMFADKETGGTFSLFFEVNDILAIYEKASIQSEIVKELHQTIYGSKEFSMKDNNGYILTFSEALK